MNSERIIELFNEAAERLPEEREAFLAASCRDQPELRQHLERLLRAGQAAAGNFLNQAASGAMRAPALVTQKPGDKIGHYKLLQQIGEGGCGVVYMAEQEEPVRRMVALKVIKLGMDTKQVIARFEAERQALALMDHPNIAKVLEAGATDTGRPYFVMELVRGIKITEYCDENSLPTRERLDLFVQVCQAVQHAHQKGVIHRDLKPSNILVTLRDGVPVPKVIDFGISKATTDQRLTDKTLFTAFEQFIGTPAYMSPEQAEMSELGIDTRSDIYSLGVLLYELLTGTTPFDSKALLQSGLEEIRRIIREVEPVKPSTRLTQEFISESKIRNQKSKIDVASPASRDRLLRIKEVLPLLRGDLDWIVMKALEKDRARRYETANGLAMDVQRYLSNEPVVARPPSKLYRLQKMARRNKLAFAAGAAVLLALVAGLVVSNSFYLREKASHKQAVSAEKEALAAKREAVATFQFLTEDLLFQATPQQNSRERHLTLEQAVTEATRRLDQTAEIRQQPRLEATLRLALGRTYHKLGKSDEADRNLRRAFELRRGELGPTNLATLEAEFCLAEYLEELPHEYSEAGTLLREVWRWRQQLLGAENRDTLEALQIYGVTLYQTAYVTEAEQIARYIVAHHRTTQGDPVEADRLLTEAIPLASREFGSTHPYVLHLQRVLARALAEEGCFVEAETLARQTLDERLRQSMDPEGNGRTMLILGRALVQKGKLDEAQHLLQAALPLLCDYIRNTDASAVLAANWLGAIQVARGAYPEAEGLLLPDSHRLFDPANQLSPTEVRLAVGNIIALYEAWRKPEQAAAWKRRLDELANPKANSPR